MIAIIYMYKFCFFKIKRNIISNFVVCIMKWHSV